MSDNIPYIEQERILTDTLKYKAKHPKATFRYFNHNSRLTKTGSGANITSNKYLDSIEVLLVMLGCLQSRIKPSTTSSTTLQALVYP